MPAKFRLPLHGRLHIYQQALERGLRKADRAPRATKRTLIANVRQGAKETGDRPEQVAVQRVAEPKLGRADSLSYVGLF